MSKSDEREILFSARASPQLQDTPGYSLILFSGPRLRIAKALFDLWEEEHIDSEIDEGKLSVRCGLSLAALGAEQDGCYRLTPEAFQLKVNALIEEKKTSELMQLVAKEGTIRLKTGSWDSETQTRIRDIIREIDELKQGTGAPDPARFLKTGHELQKLDIRVEYVVLKYLPAAGVTVFHGRGGIGKTQLVLQMGRDVAQTQKFFSIPTQTRPVVFIDYENPISVVVERARKFDIREVLFWHQGFDPRPPRLDSPEYQIFKRLPRGSLLIFDTLRASQAGDENASDQMGLVMGRLKEIRDAGFTVVALHHTPRASDRQSKGSTAITDLADHTLSLYRVRKGTFENIDDDNDPGPDALFRFGVGDKSRFEPAPPIFLKRSPAGEFVLADDPDKDRLDAIADHLKQTARPLTQTDIAEWAKAELEIAQKAKCVSLLNRGEGSLWKSHKDGFRRVYEIVR